MKSYRESIFGKLGSQEILAYTFENDRGYRLTVMNYGATVVQYVTPDKDNHFDNIVVGFNRFEDYIGNSPKHGASIGPVAGRIAGATFELNGQTFQLEVNNGLNCNHSGSSGWDSTVFEVEEVSNDGLTFYTERTDGTGGFPGNLKIWVSYTLTEKGELEISYQVQTDQDTLVSPISPLMTISCSSILVVSILSQLTAFLKKRLMQSVTLSRSWPRALPLKKFLLRPMSKFIWYLAWIILLR